MVIADERERERQRRQRQRQRQREREREKEFIITMQGLQWGFRCRRGDEIVLAYK